MTYSLSNPPPPLHFFVSVSIAPPTTSPTLSPCPLCYDPQLDRLACLSTVHPSVQLPHIAHTLAAPESIPPRGAPPPSFGLLSAPTPIQTLPSHPWPYCLLEGIHLLIILTLHHACTHQHSSPSLPLHMSVPPPSSVLTFCTHART